MTIEARLDDCQRLERDLFTDLVNHAKGDQSSPNWLFKMKYLCLRWAHQYRETEEILSELANRESMRSGNE